MLPKGSKKPAFLRAVAEAIASVDPAYWYKNNWYNDAISMYAQVEGELEQILNIEDNHLGEEGEIIPFPSKD